MTFVLTVLENDGSELLIVAVDSLLFEKKV